MTTEASKWTEDDLLNLITNAVQENVQLDYKACDALQNTNGKKAAISNAVSAFANSAGGVLIYGIIEEGHVAVRLDEGFDPNNVSKEWLEQVINSRIQRRIDGVRIYPIALPTSHPGRVAYVVAVPQSARAPHQASDKRFYKRYNFMSVPMEEYEVRDVSMRRQGPVLSIRFQVEEIPPAAAPGAVGETKVHRIKVIPIIENESPVPAEYIVINIYIDTSVTKIVSPGGLTVQGDLTLSRAGVPIVCKVLCKNHSIPGGIPIFSGTPFDLLTTPIVLDAARDKEYFLGYRLLAPYMSEVLGGVMLHVGDLGPEVRPL